MKHFKKTNSGIGLTFVLVLIAIISIGIAVTIKNTDVFRSITAAEVAKKQLSTRAVGVINDVRHYLQRAIDLAVRCHSEGPPPHSVCDTELAGLGFRFPTQGPPPNPSSQPASWAGTWVENLIVNPADPSKGPIQDRLTDANTRITIDCPGAPSDSCRWKRTSFPKVFKVVITAKDPSKGIVVQYAATIEVAPDDLRNMAYLVTSETANEVTFSGADFLGRVGVIFSGNLANRRIRFNAASPINFERVFFTNLPLEQFDYIHGSPTFRQGVATNVSGFANELHTTFTNLKSAPGVIAPNRDPNALIENVRFTLGSNGNPCDVRFTYQPEVFSLPLCIAGEATNNGEPEPTPGSPEYQSYQMACEALSPNELVLRSYHEPGALQEVHNGPAPDQGVFYADSLRTPGVIVDTHDPLSGVGSICNPNFTLIADQNILLRTSAQKAVGASSTQGNIAFVSLNGTQGVIVDQNTRSLLSNGKTFGEIIDQNYSVPSTAITYRMDASLVALGNGASAPYFSDQITHRPGHTLGVFESHGGLIGAKYDPSRLIDGGGNVTSGFNRVDMNFNDGALTSAPPGFAESQTSMIGATITSISYSIDSIEDALAAIVP